VTAELLKANPTCKTCRFFERVETRPEEGFCKENSPQVTILLIPQANHITGQMGAMPQPIASWPTVTDDLWCGRYTAKWAKLDS